MKTYKLALITWIDAQSDCNWSEDVSKWIIEDCIINEVGWIIAENKKYLILSSEIGEDGTFGNRTKIPKGWIKTRKNLPNETKKK